MLKALTVDCPKCNAACDVPLEDGDLRENQTTEGFIAECPKCGATFRFDLDVEIMNKEIMGQ